MHPDDDGPRSAKSASRGRGLWSVLDSRGRLALSLIPVAVALLATWMGFFDGGYFVGVWALPVFILAATLVLVCVAGVFPTGWPGRVALGLLAGLTLWTFATILWSPNRGDAWLGAGQTLLYLLAFWVVAALFSLGASRRYVLLASVLGPALVAALTLRQLASQYEVLFQNNRLVGSIGYYNGEAAFLLVPLWVAVYLGGSRRVSPALRGLVLAGAVLCVSLATLTQSRGAMVALALSLPVFFLLSGQRLRGFISLVPVAGALYLVFPELNDVYQTALEGADAPAALEAALPGVWLAALGAGLYGLAWGLADRLWELNRNVSRVAGAVVVSAALVGGMFGVATVTAEYGGPVAAAQDRWEAFRTNDTTGQEESRYLSASGSGRYILWETTWDAFESAPVAGIGTQNYEAYYYQNRPESAGAVRQPHILPLEVLAERGVIGGVAFFGFLGVCAFAGLRARFFANLGSEYRAQIGALAAAVSYWFIHSGAEWFWQLPAVTLPAVVYLALLVAPWHRRRGDSAPHRWPLRVAGAVVALTAIIAVAPLFMADRHVERSYEAESQQEALQLIERAGEINGAQPRIAEREAELALEAGDYERAEAAYTEAARLNPDHYAPRLYLAEFHERRGELEAALPLYREASGLNPLDESLTNRVERLEGAG